MSAARTLKMYTKEFKLEAVQLSNQEGVSVIQVAQNLGVPVKTLYRWRHELADRTEARAFPGKGKRPEESELERLQRENARLRMEREILKKAAAFFANESG
jgi:transposase